MTRLKLPADLVTRFLRSESGATAIEYGIIAALIGLVVVGAMTNLSGVLWNLMTNISTAL